MNIIKGDCYEAGLWEVRHAEAMVRDGNVFNGNRKVVELPKDYGNGKVEMKAVQEALTAAGIQYTVK